jgi:hypothetical protein
MKRAYVVNEEQIRERGDILATALVATAQHRYHEVSHREREQKTLRRFPANEHVLFRIPRFIVLPGFWTSGSPWSS